MSYFVRLNFFFWIILFLVRSGYSASQPSYDSEITPSLKRIIINGDSVIFISDSSNSRHEQTRKDITLNYKNHNIVFIISFFLKDLTRNGQLGNRKVIKSIQIFLPAGIGLK